MAQTAVEWLISEIQRHNDSGYEFHPKYNEEIIEQAKERERAQIINAYAIGCINGEIIERDLKPKYTNPIQYYNETFK